MERGMMNFEVVEMVFRHMKHSNLALSSLSFAEVHGPGFAFCVELDRGA